MALYLHDLHLERILEVQTSMDVKLEVPAQKKQEVLIYVWLGLKNIYSEISLAQSFMRIEVTLFVVKWEQIEESLHIQNMY